MESMEFLKSRGWRLVGPNPPGERLVPHSETWRHGWEPFCVELELWQTGEIRGRLCAPGMKVHGNMIFESLRSIEDAVEFLERLLKGATQALPYEGNPGSLQK